MRRRKRESTIVWDGGTEDLICRDERCTLVEVHLVHDITDTPEVIAARRYFWGWALDPFEVVLYRCRSCNAIYRDKGFCHGRRLARADGTTTPPKSPGINRRLARPFAVAMLDEIILGTISPRTVKPFRTIQDEVEADYGSLEPRRLRRRLELLRKEARVAYISFDRAGMVAGYTTPGSPLLADPLYIKEILWRQGSEFGEREAA